jgi:hypothetical protein
MGSKKRNKQPKLIDILEKALRSAGYEVERDGWQENKFSKPPFDNCEWLDVKGPMIDKKTGEHMLVHFYFTKNSNVLEEMSLYRENFDGSEQTQIPLKEENE